MNNKLHKKCMELSRHAIGMDQRKIFIREGARIYLPYRNYYTAPQPVEAWEYMVKEGWAVRQDYQDGGVRYSMTPDGIQWMARELLVNICLVY